MNVTTEERYARRKHWNLALQYLYFDKKLARISTLWFACESLCMAKLMHIFVQGCAHLFLLHMINID